MSRTALFGWNADVGSGQIRQRSFAPGVDGSPLASEVEHSQLLPDSMAVLQGSRMTIETVIADMTTG
jgi:hypothetical protein